MPVDIQVRAKWFSAEMLVAHAFAQQGYTVAIPLVQCSYDLLVDSGSAIWRVQVKLARFKRARIRPRGKGSRAHYAVDLYRGSPRRTTFIGVTEFDILCAVCERDRIYVIPTTALVSVTDPARLVGHIEIKFELKVDRTEREDARVAVERWMPYLNAFPLV